MHGLLAEGREPSEIFEERTRLYKWYAKEDAASAQAWWEWCREREITLRHLNMRFVRDCPYISCILTGAANPTELATNVKEMLTPIADDVWRDALERVAEIDG